MANIEHVNDLITAIQHDRFAEIEARHGPAARFYPFIGPDLHSAIDIGDWYREFVEDYADLLYTGNEYLEDKGTVAVRSTLEYKGYNWNRFTMNVIDVMEFDNDLVVERRQYAMLPDLELDKQQTRIYEKAREDKDAKSRKTKKAIPEFYEAIMSGDAEGAKGKLKEDVFLIDTVYGLAVGADAVVDALLATPTPAFGVWRITNAITSDQNGLVELAIDPVRPRRADWVRMVGEEIAVIERHWNLREIGALSMLQTGRHRRRVIMPI